MKNYKPIFNGLYKISECGEVVNCKYNNVIKPHFSRGEPYVKVMINRVQYKRKLIVLLYSAFVRKDIGSGTLRWVKEGIINVSNIVSCSNSQDVPRSIYKYRIECGNNIGRNYFPSIRDVAIYIGVSKYQVSRHIRDGSMINGYFIMERPSYVKKPVFYEGVVYRNYKYAAKAAGCPSNKALSILYKSSLDKTTFLFV